MTDLVIECSKCQTAIPTRRAPLVKVICPGCGRHIEVNMERVE